MPIKERGIEIRRSRRSYFYNYVLVVLVLVLFALVWAEFELTFSFMPSGPAEFQDSLVVLGFVMLIAIFLEEPTIYRMFCKYVITNNEVIKIEGILRKTRIVLPYQSVANVNVYKGVLGRILNFGDITILGFKDQINMKGIHEPEVFYRIINNKIAVMRGTAPKVAGIEKEVEGKKIMSTDWRKKQKELERKIQPLKGIAPPATRRGGKSDVFGFLKSFRPVEDEKTQPEEEDIEEGIEGDEEEETMEEERGVEQKLKKKRERRRKKRERKPKGKKR